jgi:Family of unknown function (DUF6117)
MAIPVGYIANFETILRAAKNEDLALVECTNKQTGEPVYVVAAIGGVGPDDKMEVVPLALLFDGNPYEMLIPPSASDKKGN